MKQLWSLGSVILRLFLSLFLNWDQTKNLCIDDNYHQNISLNAYVKKELYFGMTTQTIKLCISTKIHLYMFKSNSCIWICICFHTVKREFLFYEDNVLWVRWIISRWKCPNLSVTLNLPYRRTPMYFFDYVTIYLICK